VEQSPELKALFDRYVEIKQAEAVIETDWLHAENGWKQFKESASSLWGKYQAKREQANQVICEIEKLIREQQCPKKS
jgi:hypothetical protein